MTESKSGYIDNLIKISELSYADSNPKNVFILYGNFLSKYNEYEHTTSFFKIDHFKRDSLKNDFWSLEDAILLLKQLCKLCKNIRLYTEKGFDELDNIGRLRTCLEKYGEDDYPELSTTIIDWYNPYRVSYFDKNGIEYPTEINEEHMNLVFKLAS